MCFIREKPAVFVRKGRVGGGGGGGGIVRVNYHTKLWKLLKIKTAVFYRYTPTPTTYTPAYSSKTRNDENGAD